MVVDVVAAAVVAAVLIAATAASAVAAIRITATAAVDVAPVATVVVTLRGRVRGSPAEPKGGALRFGYCISH